MLTTSHYGATPEEWDLFVSLGLTGDLLPVVSNPSAEISENSEMKSVGKTPSVYNDKGKVVGIQNWTQLVAQPKAIEFWKQQADYGICIQTRNIRAIDIDVDDPAKSHKIMEFIQARAPQRLPVRYRSNSGKLLMAYRLEGEFAKRIMKVDGGIVEFLMNGQQFVAAGTHTSGVRYEWDWGNSANGNIPEFRMFQ